MSHPLLTAPIGPSLLKLAGPTTAVMVAQTFVAIAETFIFGRLGTPALAGFALVFPFMMMMTMMAAGGMGGGVAAAMARALGGGRIDDARALVLHALVLGAGLALLFTLLAWTAAPALYRLLGGEGQALDNALAYSHVLFSGSLVIWANFFLSALLRGGGDAATPGRYMLFSSLAQVPLSYVLALGIGDWPGLGMAGPAVSSLLTSTVSALLQARALWRGKLGFVPALRGIPLQGRLFWDILRVGLIASFSAFTANLTAMVVTGLVGRFGVAALAGYGIGVRLEFMLVPLAFGIGSGLTTGRRGGRRARLEARGARRLDRRADRGRHDRKPRLGRGVAAGELVAPFHQRSQGDRHDGFLHHARGAVLLPVRSRHDAELRQPGRGPHAGAVRRRHHSHAGGHDRWLVCHRYPGSRPRGRLLGDRRRHGCLRRHDRGTAASQALGTKTRARAW